MNALSTKSDLWYIRIYHIMQRKQAKQGTGRTKHNDWPFPVTFSTLYCNLLAMSTKTNEIKLVSIY